MKVKDEGPSSNVGGDESAWPWANSGGIVDGHCVGE